MFNYNVYNVWERKENNTVEIELKDTLTGQAFSMDTITYNNTVTVWHKYETQISYEVYRAVYAENIGLLYKQMIYYYSDDASQLPIEERITYGVHYTQTILSYGN